MMSTQQSAAPRSKKGVVIAGVCLVAQIAAFALIYFHLMPRGEAGAKSITVDVVRGDGSAVSHALDTEEEFLRGALEEAGLVSGSEGPYGLYITEVDGIRADDAEQQWWRLTKDGALVNTGVDATPIADGDRFELTLVTGYDA